jgi:hypothetical protein
MVSLEIIMWCTSCVHHTIGLNGTLSTQCNILRPCYYRSIIDGAAEAILRRVKALCWQQFFYKDGEDKRNMKKTEFDLGFLVLKTFAKIKTRIHTTIDIRVVNNFSKQLNNLSHSRIQTQFELQSFLCV